MNIQSKYNNFWLGVSLGLILPVLGFFLSKEIKAPQLTLARYWQIFTDPDLEVNKDIIVFSILPNMALFYMFFFKLKYDYSAKGLVLSTLIIGGLSFLLTT